MLLTAGVSGSPCTLKIYISGGNGFFFYSCLFILRENKQCELGRGREGIPSRLGAVSVEPDVGLDLLNCGIMRFVRS